MKIKRLFLVFGIIGLFGVCYFYMNSHFDRLSRYPYEYPEARAKIDAKLNDQEIEYLIDLSAKLKKQKKKGIKHQVHKGKNVALIFEKTSTRTRCAFEVACADLGANAVYSAEFESVAQLLDGDPAVLLRLRQERHRGLLRQEQRGGHGGIHAAG